MFFECCVAKVIWNYISDFLGMEIGSDYISVASKWLSEEKSYTTNVISSTVMRGFDGNKSLYLVFVGVVFFKASWTAFRAVMTVAS
jgi:hypothetical protein